MTKEQREIFGKTVKRLARGGILDPTAQIIALAEEIERYRDKIHALEELLKKATETKAPPAPMPSTEFRLTRYDQDLDCFVVPLFVRADGSRITLSIKTGGTYKDQTGMVYTVKEPDVVFGEIIDRLAELENKEEAKQ